MELIERYLKTAEDATSRWGGGLIIRNRLPFEVLDATIANHLEDLIPSSYDDTISRYCTHEPLRSLQYSTNIRLHLC